MKYAQLAEAFYVAVGNLGRRLYEWADARLDTLDPPDVVGHAEVRLGSVKTRWEER